jgi:hypothetical protein
VFTWYLRFILDEFQISYLNYWVPPVEAAVLAKVIMVGDILRLARGVENKPSIFPTLYKAVMFSVWVGVFSVLEHTVGGVNHGKGLTGGL